MTRILPRVRPLTGVGSGAPRGSGSRDSDDSDRMGGGGGREPQRGGTLERHATRGPRPDAETEPGGAAGPATARRLFACGQAAAGLTLFAHARVCARAGPAVIGGGARPGPDSDGRRARGLREAGPPTRRPRPARDSDPC